MTNRTLGDTLVSPRNEVQVGVPSTTVLDPRNEVQVGVPHEQSRRCKSCPQPAVPNRTRGPDIQYPYKRVCYADPRRTRGPWSHAAPPGGYFLLS